MSANKFTLKAHHVEVIYTVGAAPFIAAVIYEAGGTKKEFKPDEVAVEDTDLGKLVSIPLVTSIDTGGERFGFFLPMIDVPRGKKVHFQTIGIYDKFGGPDSIPHRPQSWRSIEMTGTAESVIVPLEEGAKAA